MTISPRLAPAIALAIASALASPARGQLPQPRLHSAFPPGGRAGETAELRLGGADLEGTDALWFDHPGLRAFRLKDGTFRVAVAPGVSVGHHDVRALGPLGVSNARTFVVGDRAESCEAESNNLPVEANPLALNAVVNGRIEGTTDVDCFAFEGKRGQRVFLDLAAERIDSPLDATLRVEGPDGREVAEAQDVFGADPFLDLTLPADGRYVAKVHDVTYGGSADHVYRLTLHDGPHLDAVLPAAARPGVATTLTLLGRNVGGAPASGLSVDGRPLEGRPITITPPADAPAPGLDFVPSRAASRRGSMVRIQGPTGWSNPVFLAEALDPVAPGRKPANGTDRVQEVAPPCDITGTFASAGDVGVYRFRGRKGDVWWVEASAERIGSPADPFFVIQSVLPDGPPRDLAAGDDTADPGLGPQFPAGTVDAAVRWQVPEDGVYQVAVSDLYGAQRGDARLVYRLNIRPERPDFRLYIVPDAPKQLDALTLRAGGRASATLLAARLDGFAGPIRVEPTELPPGVSCDPVVIPAGAAQAPVVLGAAEEAKPVAGVVRLVGRAVGGDPATAREVLAGAMTWPPPPTLHGQPTAPARLTRGFVVAVREPAGFRVTARPAAWVVGQGHQLNLDIEVARGAGVVEPVQVWAADLPPTMPAASVTIPVGAGSGQLPLFVPRTVPPGPYSIVLRGSGPVPFHKDPDARDRPTVAVTAPSNPISVIVRPAPVSLSVDARGGVLKQGEALEVGVAARRQGGCSGEVSLSLSAPAALRLSADPVAVSPGQESARLLLRAAADSPPGAAAGVAVRAVGTVQGEAIEVDEPLPLTIQTK